MHGLRTPSGEFTLEHYHLFNIATIVLVLSALAGGTFAVPTDNLFPAGTDRGGLVTYYFLDQLGRKGTTFQPYAGFTGGVRVAVGDVNGDGRADLITAPGRGKPQAVKVWDGTSLQGTKPTELLSFFPFTEDWVDGLNVAAGDFDGDGKAEIVTGQDTGDRVVPAVQLPTPGSQVRVWKALGDGSVQPYPGNLGALVPFPNFNGGVRLAVMDMSRLLAGTTQSPVTAVTTVSTGSLVCAAGPGGEPRVKSFMGDGSVRWDFLAYPAEFKGGVYVAAGDVNGDGFSDIVTGPGPTKSILIGLLLPAVQTFQPNPNSPTANPTLLESFVPYDAKFTGGVRVGVGCPSDPSQAAFTGPVTIFTAPGPGGNLPIKQFRHFDPALNLSPDYFTQIGFDGFFPFGPRFKSGILIDL